MARRSRFEQLDVAVEAMLARPDAKVPDVGPALAPLLRVASELRDLPRQEFKARLKADLERKTTVTTATVSYMPQGYHTVTPYLTVREAAELIEFVKQAFGAEERFRTIGSAGGIHCEVQIGDSMMMLGGGGAWKGTPMPTAIHLYVKDVDAVYEQAVRAGAISIQPPTDQFYGDREAGVKDLAGNYWYIATNQATGHVPEGMHTVNVYLHPHGAPQVIDFLKRAFGAVEVDRAESPDGVVHHSRMRIGSSVVEMGEAHGEFQPMPTMLYLYVEDCDALYRRAVEAGATSLNPPADQTYGDRSAGVQDPFGNQWYLATHIKDLG
jgi:PhnB protein